MFPQMRRVCFLMRVFSRILFFLLFLLQTSQSGRGLGVEIIQPGTLVSLSVIWNVCKGLSLHLGWGLRSPLGCSPRGKARWQVTLTLPATCRDPSRSVRAGCCGDQTSVGMGSGWTLGKEEVSLLSQVEHLHFNVTFELSQNM